MQVLDAPHNLHLRSTPNECTTVWRPKAYITNKAFQRLVALLPIIMLCTHIVANGEIEKSADWRGLFQ